MVEREGPGRNTSYLLKMANGVDYQCKNLYSVSTEADKGQSQNIYEIRKMFLKSEKVFQIVMFFGNRRRRVYQI